MRSILVMIALGFGSGWLGGGAEAATFANPTWNGYALDWCRTFENGCGKPAADLWCQRKGYVQALSFTQLPRVRFQTMTVGNNAICDPRSHVCDSFSSISCQERVVTFARPTLLGYRLDWCRQFEGECGAPAAAQFCQTRGFARLAGFAFEGPVSTPTMTVGSHAICDPRFHRCDSFRFVRCAN